MGSIVGRGSQKATHKEPKRNPKGIQEGTQKDTQKEPKRNPTGIQKGTQKERRKERRKEPKRNPKGTQKETKRKPKGNQKEPKRNPKNNSKGIQKGTHKEYYMDSREKNVKIFGKKGILIEEYSFDEYGVKTVNFQQVKKKKCNKKRKEKGTENSIGTSVD